MARIPYPDPDTFDADTRSVLDKLPPLNLFRMMAGGGALLNNFVRLGPPDVQVETRPRRA